MKKAKKSIEISQWKVEGTDAFDAITPGWTDDELDIGPNNEDYSDDDHINIETQAQELNIKNIHKRK